MQLEADERAQVGTLQLHRWTLHHSHRAGPLPCQPGKRNQSFCGVASTHRAPCKAGKARGAALRCERQRQGSDSDGAHGRVVLVRDRRDRRPAARRRGLLPWHVLWALAGAKSRLSPRPLDRAERASHAPGREGRFTGRRHVYGIAQSGWAVGAPPPAARQAVAPR